MYNETRKNKIDPPIKAMANMNELFFFILFFKLFKLVLCFVINTFTTANIC